MLVTRPDALARGGGEFPGQDRWSPGRKCFHTITLSGQAVLKINGPVVLHLTGQLNGSGSSIVNSSYKPSNLQISTSYSGTSGVTLSGGSSSYLVVYAPLAGITISGGSPVFGALLGQTLVSSGNTALHYDTALGDPWAAFGL